MITTAVPNDDNQQPDSAPAATTKTISLPSRDQTTAIQVGTLLNAAMALRSLLFISVDDEDAQLKPQTSEACVAAETTISKICARLDSIVDDADRWSLGSQRKLEDSLAKVYTTHLEVMEAQKQAMATANAPHRHAGIKLVQVSGIWVACLGNPNTKDCIVGIGDCPAEACADFDKIFNGEKTQNEHTQPEPVDDPRAKHPAPASPKRRNRRRDSSGDRKDAEGGVSQD